MTAQCFQTQLDFQPYGRRAVTAKFDSEQISSNGGDLLSREVDKRTDLIRRLPSVSSITATRPACDTVWSGGPARPAHHGL